MEDEMMKEALLETATEMGPEKGWEFVRDLPDELTIGDEWLAMAICKTFPEVRQKLIDSMEVGDE